MGPYAREVDITEIQPGDVCQLALDRDTFHHTPVIVKTGLVPDFSNVLVAAHSRDVDCRPLDTYSFRKVRFLHIEGVRTIVNPQYKSGSAPRSPVGKKGAPAFFMLFS